MPPPDSRASLSIAPWLCGLGLATLPAQDNTVAIVAIAVSGGVGLAAAVIAPIAAHFRQKAALREEADRLDRQLAHDRLVRDLEELRQRLDEVVEIGEAALSAVCEARLQFNAEDYGACDRQLQQAQECLGQYGFKERRVMLRTGCDHNLIPALGHFRERIQSLYALVKDSTSQRNEVPGDQWNAGMAEVGAAQITVIEAAKQSVGSEIDPSS